MKRISESDLRIRAQEAFPGCMDDVLEQLVSIGLRGYEQGRAGWYKEGDFSSDADFCYGVGAEIAKVEEALGTADDAVSAFYQRAHSEGLAAHSETCMDHACCPWPKLVLDNQGDDEGTVLVSMEGPNAGGIAKHLQSVADARWEGTGEGSTFAYACVSDRPDLEEVLKREGYALETSCYAPPSR